MFDFLSPVALPPGRVAQTLGDFGTGDVQTTHGPLCFSRMAFVRTPDSGIQVFFSTTE